MATTMTTKGQVTIPKKIRDSVGLQPGSRVEFFVDEKGRIVIKSTLPPRGDHPDRFDRARGKASRRWTTDHLMTLLRDDD
jgi:antitoxin PrlF